MPCKDHINLKLNISKLIGWKPFKPLWHWKVPKINYSCFTPIFIPDRIRLLGSFFRFVISILFQTEHSFLKYVKDCQHFVCCAFYWKNRHSFLSTGHGREELVHWSMERGCTRVVFRRNDGDPIWARSVLQLFSLRLWCDSAIL